MQKFIIRDKCSRYCRNKKQCKLGACGNGNYELQVPNNEFPFGLVVFAGADIYQCSYNRSAFRQQLQWWLFPQVGDLRLWMFLPFRQKWAGELKASTAMDISVFEGVFGLKSRIFIRNYKLPISNYECDHLHFSICDYLREPIYFFSRRSTLIYFLRPSAILICEYLRELFFLNFLTHA